MDNNSIKVGIEIDEAQIKRQLSDLEKKIKRMRETGPGGSIAQLSQQYRNTGQEEKAARLDQIRERAAQQNRNSMLRDLKQQENILDKLMKKEQAMQSIMDKKLVGGRAMEATLERQLTLTNKIAMQSKVVRAAVAGPDGPDGEMCVAMNC